MRGPILAVLAVVVGSLATLVLERWMSNAPEWVWRLAYVVVGMGGTTIVLFSEPAYTFLRDFSKHPVASTAIVAGAGAVVLGTIWCFLIVGFPSSKAYLHPVEEVPSSQTQPKDRPRFTGTKSKDDVVSPPSVTPAPSAAQPSASLPSSPSVAASPAALPPTASPLPSIVSPSPREIPLGKLTALQIMGRIEAASPYNRDEVRAAFINRPFSEVLFFRTASRIGPKKETMLVFFRFEGIDNLLKRVTCCVPTKGNEYLPALADTERFLVKGTIEQASAMDISLKDASIEQIHE